MTTNLLWVYVVWTIVIKYSDFCLVELIRCGLSRDSGEEKSQLIFNLPLDYSQFNKSLSENKSELSRYIKWQRERRYCALLNCVKIIYESHLKIMSKIEKYCLFRVEQLHCLTANSLLPMQIIILYFEFLFFFLNPFAFYEVILFHSFCK